MHLVVRDILRLHRAEGPKANMECNVANLYTHPPHLLQQLRGKMEPGSGGGGGARHPGVDRLIPLLVLKLRLDIGRQRHPAQLLQNLQENPLVVEPDRPFSVVQLLLHSGGELSISKYHLGPRLQLPPRPDQTLPQIAALIDKEKHFTGSSGRPMSDKPGGEHPGVVQHQAVPRPEEPGQVVKVVVPDGPALPVQGEQAGGVPFLQGGLGDQLLGERKIKIRCFQRRTPLSIQPLATLTPGK